MLRSSLFIFFLSFVIIGTISHERNNKSKTLPSVNSKNNSQTNQQLAYIFESGTKGYNCFRIPAIVRTKEKTLLAFAEARKESCSDSGNIDLVLRRSTDGGETWGEMITVWDEKQNTAGNPAPVVDQNTGRIHLLLTWNLGEEDIGEINQGTSKDTRRVFYTWSDDDGLNWNKPDEITNSVKKSGWGWYATGPVHGIQLSRGVHKGRLIIPCDHIEVGPNGNGYSHVIYSDNEGQNWQLGGIAARAGTNESTVAELSDGRLMLNMRSNEPYRHVAISHDAGETWPVVSADKDLIEPTCQGSLLSCTIEGRHSLLFSNPASTSRTNMTIKMSVDDGKTWAKSYTVYEGPSAYSDIATIDEDQVGILYEAGVENPYGGIVFERISLKNFE